ncbi:MAG: DNA polymerase III subunit delta' [bacterium]
MRFVDILGQDSAKKILQGIITHQKFAGAYMFLGPSGVGKYSSAMAFAAAINCEKGGVDACGECISCKKMISGNHPDLIHLVPEGDKKYLSIEQIRELNRLTMYGPHEGKRMVVVLRDLESAKIEASNAFLKLLEEPPKNVTLIILTDRPEYLLDTIRSRTQKIIFSELSPGIIKSYLISHYSLSPAQAEAYFEISGGSLGKACKLIEVFPDLSWVLKEVSDAEGKSYLEWNRFITELEKQKENSEDLLNILLFSLWKKVNSAKYPQRIIDAMKAILDGVSQIKRRSNFRLALDIIFLKVADSLA